MTMSSACIQFKVQVMHYREGYQYIAPTTTDLYRMDPSGIPDVTRSQLENIPLMHLSMSSPTYPRSGRGEDWWVFANAR